MKLVLPLIVVLIAHISLYSQSEFPWQMPTVADYPKVKQFGKNPASFVPSGFKVVKSARGDLNGDGQKDIAMHIVGTSEKFLYTSKDGWVKEFDTNPRILLILFKESKKGGYRLVAQNNEFIPFPDSPSQSEPIQDLQIRKGVLHLDMEIWYSMGRWEAANLTYKFRFQNGDFYLIGTDREDYVRHDFMTNVSSYNFSTMRVKRVEKVRESSVRPLESRRAVITWERLQNISIRRLSEMGPAFSWEIEQHLFI